MSKQRASGDSQGYLKGFIAHALACRDKMLDYIRKYPPNSTERHQLYAQIRPSHVTVTETWLNHAIAEARQNREQDFLGPRLEALESGLRDYAYTFLDHPQGNVGLAEPTALTNAINALLPYVGASGITRQHHTDHGSTSEVGPEQDKQRDGDEMMSCTVIAERYCVPQEALRKRLGRYRRKHLLDSTWTEVQNRAAKQSRYLYRLSAIQPIIEEMRVRLRSAKGSALR